MTCLSADAISEIIPYLDMPTLRKMIDLSEDMESSMRDSLLLEFHRRGEKFINWVNSLRVVREVTGKETTEITYISESVMIRQSLLLFGDCSLSRIIMLDGVEMKSTRSWNNGGTMTLSYNHKDGEYHGLYEKWNNQGVKTSSANYKDGQLHGLFEIWNYQGVNLFSINYENGQIH